ncbi:terminase family protein [soil metagenome]
MVDALSDAEVFDYLENWCGWSRTAQVPEAMLRQDWRTWLIMGGRGAGKTRSGAEWVKAKALGHDWGGTPATRIALIGATYDDARRVMVEGVSGVLAVHDMLARPEYESSRRLITWPNGAVAQIFSGEDPDGLRGPQFDCAWCDEFAKWRDPQAAWDMLQFALRLGDQPQVLVTTTPRPLPVLKRLLARDGVVVSQSPTADNRGFLADGFIAEMRARYGGTRLGRQELDGEIIADDPDAMFARSVIETHRVGAAPPLARIVVAIDPPAGNNTCGIVAAGKGEDGRLYVLDDATVVGKGPAHWAAAAVALYHALGADRVVAEVNQGGSMVEAVLREVDPAVSYRAVHASRGKRARAEPVAALYEQGRASHVGAFPALEDELCGWRGTGDRSPDRLDALVWAVSDLMLRPRTMEPRVSVL